MREKNNAVRLFASVAGLAFLCHCPASAESKPAEAAAQEEVMTLKTPSRDERLKKLDQTKLHRLDFRVVGSGCASCLGRVRKRVEKVKGVLEVAVCIKQPYGCAIIYDSSKTNVDELLKEGKKDEKVNVTFVDMEDQKISAPPLILVPKFNSLIKGDSTAKAAPQ